MLPTICSNPPTGFADLGLDPRLHDTLKTLSHETPTPIQLEAIPPLLLGRDLLGQAATGTGKTAAFALPLLHRLANREDGDGKPAALVLVPTRELAMQVADAVRRYGAALETTVLAVYGGQGLGEQARELKRGVDVIVATPGRALDHLRRGTLRLDGITTVVLDEADEMLAMGFAEDLDAILTATPDEKQTMLFSATMPTHITAIAARHLRNPVEVRVGGSQPRAGEMPRVRQTAYLVSRAHKLAALIRVLEVEEPTAALVFCRTRTEVDELTERLHARGYRPEALHGGMSQEQRDRVMRLFRAGSASLLIATDVAARGLDVEHLSHVINFHVPPEVESYVHRIGRVGRAGREGVAITVAEPRERGLLRNVERATRQPIEIAPVPDVEELRTRRLERTRATLRAAILEGNAEPYRDLVESLASEFDPKDVALAAVKLLRQGDRAAEEEIPSAHRERSADAPRPHGKPARRAERGRGRNSGMARLFIGAGRSAGVAPRDLVGMISHESGMPSRDIGTIDVTDRFSLVEVPAEVIEYVIESLQSVRIKGRRVPIRRDRADSDR